MHPAATLLASPESGEVERSSPSSSKKLKPQSSAATNSNGKAASTTTIGENTNNETNERAAAATKTAKVTRITSKNNGYINNNATSIKGKDINNNNYDDSSSSIQGLQPNKSFNLYCRIHCTLTLLQKHFPTLLELPPLSLSTAKQWIYDQNVTISGPRGGKELLAVGLEEVLLLSRALATAATAARRRGKNVRFGCWNGIIIINDNDGGIIEKSRASRM